jgi:G3E family GTPase
VAFGDVPLDEVFDVGGFNLTSDLELEPMSLCAKDDHDHHDHHHHHDDDVKSFVFRSERPLHGARFAQFMNSLVKGYGPALLRYKGVLNMAGEDRKVIFQGVHQLMSHHVGASWTADDARQSRLVFIGLNLPQALMMQTLQQCLV